jgi:molybdopterin/thiamine biosynthesis adenylyltransferase
LALTEREIARYARQLLLPGLGEAGQERLKAARVRVAGAGAIGAPALLYLAGGGIGTILVDDAAPVGERDQGSWIYPPSARGTLRAVLAIEAARAANAFVEVAAYRPVDAVTAALVALDSQEERKAAAEALRIGGIPHVVAEADGEGGAVTVVPVGAPCYACAFRPGFNAPPAAAATAALGALAATELVLLVAGAVQGPRGRRLELIRGQLAARATVRLPGCGCSSGQGGGA